MTVIMLEHIAVAYDELILTLINLWWLWDVPIVIIISAMACPTPKPVSPNPLLGAII
jgi:hypothetical protein